MLNIILLAQDRRFAREALDRIAKRHKSGDIAIKAIVSERSLHEWVREILDADIAWIDTETCNEADVIDLIRAQEIDTAISLQHRWIVSGQLIDAVNGNAFNTHFGKLPEYRGHYTHTHAILNGEGFVTTTLHWLDAKVDLGDIIAEAKTPITPDDTAWSLWHKSVDEAVTLQDKLLDDLISGTAPARRPIGGKGTFYRVDSIDGLKNIQNPDDFDDVDKKARAFYYPPHEPAYFVLNNKKFYVIPKGVYHQTAR